MKKFLLTLALLATTAILAACNNTPDALPAWSPGEALTITIGASPRPHAEVLRYIAPQLQATYNITLDIREFTDFPVVNPALADGTLDANYFQHRPFLNASPYADDLHMIDIVHIEPIGAYSHTLASIDDLPQGATIAIPNDATNHGRALLLLQANGLLELNPDAGILATYTSHIAYNPLGLQFRALDASLLPRILDDPAIDMAIINTNHVLAGTDLNPMRDSLIIESSDSPFANGLVVRNADSDHPAMAALMRTLRSEEVREFLLREFDGAVVPMF